MGGLSTISLDPQVMTALTPSCSSNEVGPVCTCQTTDTIHKHTVHMHPHLDKVKARGSDFYIRTSVVVVRQQLHTASITMRETESDATAEQQEKIVS